MVKNIIANFVGKFWSLLSNFLFIPLYIHFLGFESYSIISFTLVIAGLMVVLDAGLTATLSREFARTDHDKEYKIRIFKTLESTYLIIVSIVIIIVFFASNVIAEHWLHLSSLTPEKVSIYLKIISFDVGFQLLFRFYLGGLLGLEKQVDANLYQIGWGVLRNGCVVILLFFIPNLEFFFIWQTVSTILFTVLLKLAIEKLLNGHISLVFKPIIEKVVFKGVWKFAGGMLLIAFISSLNTQLDKLSISKLLSIESLGYYTLAVSLAQGLFILASPFATAILPRLTSLYSSGRTTEATTIFNRISLIVAVIVFSVMANMAFFSKELIWIWTGQMKLAEHVSYLIPVVAFSYTMYSLQLMPYNVAIANGYTKLNNLLGILSLVITLPGYWLATKYYGAFGAAIVFCFVQTLSTFIFLYFINRKFMKFNNLTTMYIKQLFMPLAVSILVAFIFSILPDMTGYGRIISFCWIGLSTMITLLITTVIIIPAHELKQFVKTKAF
jgi:O-antigen/teichoic acid export membrane protein